MGLKKRMAGVNKKGFTLIELIFVIAILAILAAIVVPAYINLVRQSRIAVLNGVAGSLWSAVSLAKTLHHQNPAASTVDFEGQTVTVNSVGTLTYDAAGIGTAMGFPTPVGGVSTHNGITATFKPGVVEFRPEGVSSTALCMTAYSIFSATGQPSVTVDGLTGDC